MAKKATKSKVEIYIKKRLNGKTTHEYEFIIADGNKIESFIKTLGAFEKMGRHVIQHHFNLANKTVNKVKKNINKGQVKKDLKKVKNKAKKGVKKIKKVIKKGLKK